MTLSSVSVSPTWLDLHRLPFGTLFLLTKTNQHMAQQNINKANHPANAMDSKEKVHSNDNKMKQDFPGYPGNPASEDEFKEQKNWRTDFSNESDTTATGSESIRSKRPTEDDNKGGNVEDLKGNDRGMNLHEEDPDEVENNDARS
jgi:hypothetical protein